MNLTSTSCLFLKPLIWPISTRVLYTVSWHRCAVHCQHLCAVHCQSASVCSTLSVSICVCCTVSWHLCAVHCQHVTCAQSFCISVLCTVSICVLNSHIALYPAKKQSETSVPKVDTVGHHQPACSILPF